MSVRASSSTEPRACSGLMYQGVPAWPRLRKTSVYSERARPKSTIFAAPSAVSLRRCDAVGVR